MDKSQEKVGLILSGGGARGAYQVGVLKAVSEILSHPRKNPFPILCGTSAGAINAAALAVYAQNFKRGVERLAYVWENFHVHHVYRSDAYGVARSGAHWLSALMFGWLVHQNPKSLLDNSPLAELLQRYLDFSRIEQAIDAGALYALSITASGYSSGQSVSFYQGGEGIGPWQRIQRVASKAKISVEHLMASSAIPFIFPAVKISREYFGDGSMRQLAPISPALHLGAERIMVIGVGRMLNEPPPRVRSDRYPSLAEIAGHVMSSIFLDSMSTDLERLERINKTLELIPESVRSRQKSALRRVEIMVISPSEPLDRIAVRHLRCLPWAIRVLFGGVGAMTRRGATLASYLLFEKEYCQALIDLGYKDTMARQEEVLEFFK